MEQDAVNVLVIDDDPDIRMLLTDALHGEGYTVVAVGTAEEGLSQLPYMDFAVAFVDHNLPAMDGLTLSGYLRRANQRIEVVLITGSEDETLRRAADEEDVRFLSKPLDIDDLLTVVEEQIAQRACREAATQDEDYAPRLGLLATSHLGQELQLPPASARLGNVLAKRVKRCLSRLRSPRSYDEQDRVLALAGLITSRVLGVSLPCTSDGRTLFEEYDRLMARMGKRTEFVGREG